MGRTLDFCKEIHLISIKTLRIALTFMIKCSKLLSHSMNSLSLCCVEFLSPFLQNLKIFFHHKMNSVKLKYYEVLRK